MHIRPMTEADCAAVCALWNPFIRDTLVTFTGAEKTPQELVQMLAEKARAGHGALVLEEGGRVTGYAGYGQFRGGPGYRHTMEHTILLAPESRSRGQGRALMAALEDHARAAGAHSMFAGVSAANPEGVAFHAAIGYREVARLAQVGRKFGQWLDLVLMQKMLAPRDMRPADSTGQKS